MISCTSYGTGADTRTRTRTITSTAAARTAGGGAAAMVAATVTIDHYTIGQFTTLYQLRNRVHGLERPYT